MPNFFLEAKGPDGSLAVARRQACYDGALGARGIHSLQSFGTSKPVYDNNAYTIESIYHGRLLSAGSWGVSKRERLGKGAEKQAYTRRKRQGSKYVHADSIL
jgi:hypothetical protein